MLPTPEKNNELSKLGKCGNIESKISAVSKGGFMIGINLENTFFFSFSMELC